MNSQATALPVLDISPFLLDENSPGGKEVVNDLMRICNTVGFVYITGHGIPETVSSSVLDLTRKFFDLPESDRLAIVNTKSPHFRGYTRLGMEHTNGAPDWREQIDVGPECAPVALALHDPTWLRLRGPNQWPPALPALRPAVSEWMARMEALSRTILRALALGLGQPADHFDYAVHPGPEVLVKLMRYPSVPGGGRQGVGAHQDAGLLSFILQDDVGGLEVLPDGGAPPIPAPARPGAYVMNLGQMLQLATGGFFRATLHRVNAPPHPGPHRISAAYFFTPRMESRLRPVALPPALAAAAAGPAGGQNENPADPIFATYGENLLKTRLRSHPDVAAIHHPDLLPAQATPPPR
jgi:isopenicillin N synthase-like dioxygenase